MTTKKLSKDEYIALLHKNGLEEYEIAIVMRNYHKRHKTSPKRQNTNDKQENQNNLEDWK